jgi:tRNA (guanine37-N1)-methyltransferase
MFMARPRSYDIVGSSDKAVAIVEIRDEGAAGEKEMAEQILRDNPSVKSVLKKLSERKGEFRNREYQLLAGDPNTQVLHKEHGYVLQVDPQKSYFSVREGTERQRIASQVKPNEIVMVMFAGVGPYAIAIAKAQPMAEKVIAVEINPDAVESMRYNVRVNKIAHKVVPVLGDVRDACKPWFGMCDRVVMPLPLGAESFLDVAVACGRPGSIVHLYGWGNEEDGDIFAAAEKSISEQLGKLGRKYEIVGKRKVLPYAPGRFKVCVEFRLL